MTDTLALLDPLLIRGGTEVASSALLRQALRHGIPPPERRVFVNRTLRLETIRHVGFDLDWTLADYKRRPLEQLTFELAVERLIAEHGYPRDLRRLEYRPDFPRRGLLIDKEAGVVLCMNRHRFVGQAYQGRRRLDRDERIRLYRQDPLNPSSERFYHADSLFELPETDLYAELVELSQRRPSLSLPGPRRLFEDTRSAVDWIHAAGPLKRRVLADPERFLVRNRELGLALERLALGGRRLILITNSDWEYVAGVCSYLFDGLLPGVDSWRELFDLVVVSSRKPGFFRRDKPFAVLDDRGREDGTTETPRWGGVYRGGSLEGLMRLLDCPGEQVLYVGDHIYGDIVSSKLGSTWRTALIVHELEDEFRQRLEHSYDIERLTLLRHRLAELGHQMDRLHDVVTLCQQLAQDGADLSAEAQGAIHSLFVELREHHRTMRLRVSRLGERISAASNPYWGSFFKQGSSKTLFAAQLEAYACLYTSRASNFGFYGTNHYFRVIEDSMMHEGVTE